MSVLEPGAVFGRDFRVVKALKAGGMGAVYIVDQISTGKQRALKVMAAELAHDPAIRERFVLEARAASRIESDHVVEIVTAGVDEETGAPYLVMELLRGEELAEVATRSGPLPLGDVAEILAQVGHALEQAHAHGIVHRDLKPENIFLAYSRRRDVGYTSKVLDFGIAKLVADSQKTGTQPLGTPLFMSPEQTDRKGRICPATDVWALGLIAFLLLTGKHFWLEADGSLPMLLREIVVERIPFASERAQAYGVAHTIPPGFDAWFARCVNQNVDARFQEAGEAVRAFAELVTADAPRGGIVLKPYAGPILDPLSFVSPVASSGPIRQPSAGTYKMTPTGQPVADEAAVVNARTIGASGQVGAASAKKSSPLPIIAVLALAVGGTAAFFGLRDKTPPASGVPTSSAATAPSQSAAPSAEPAGAAASAAPVVRGTKCADGMVLIPEGKMFMGARDLPEEAFAKPPHEVMVSGFCLDKTEVTTKAYLDCVNRGECERPLEKVSWPGLTDEVKRNRYSPLCNANRAAEAGEHPINCVAWAMADNFCKKHKKRLPTEAEWEYAARGSSQRKYPWGDEAPSAKFLNACGKECAKWGETNNEPKKTMYEEEDPFSTTAPVGRFPAGASAHGVMDLAGNVWEWTADFYAPYTEEPGKDPRGPEKGDKRVLRGGDFFGHNPDWARPAWRWKTDPDTYNHAIGFRCAGDLG